MSNPPPGWYPHPSDPSSQGYWGGSTWTDQRRPKPSKAQQARDERWKRDKKQSLIAWGVLIAIILILVGVFSGDSSDDEQDDIVASAMDDCLIDYVLDHDVDPIDQLFMSDSQQNELTECAEEAIGDDAPDWDCDTEGCWDENDEGYTWQDTALAYRCTRPDYGDACSDPRNQRP